MRCRANPRRQSDDDFIVDDGEEDVENSEPLMSNRTRANESYRRRMRYRANPRRQSDDDFIVDDGEEEDEEEEVDEDNGSSNEDMDVNKHMECQPLDFDDDAQTNMTGTGGGSRDGTPTEVVRTSRFKKMDWSSNDSSGDSSDSECQVHSFTRFYSFSRSHMALNGFCNDSAILSVTGKKKECSLLLNLPSLASLLIGASSSTKTKKDNETMRMSG